VQNVRCSALSTVKEATGEMGMGYEEQNPWKTVPPSKTGIQTYCSSSRNQMWFEMWFETVVCFAVDVEKAGRWTKTAESGLSQLFVTVCPKKARLCGQ
jgi:hypothetical protein